jgi:hypothetical protein
LFLWRSSYLVMIGCDATRKQRSQHCSGVLASYLKLVSTVMTVILVSKGNWHHVVLCTLSCFPVEYSYSVRHRSKSRVADIGALCCATSVYTPTVFHWVSRQHTEHQSVAH